MPPLKLHARHTAFQYTHTIATQSVLASHVLIPCFIPWLKALDAVRTLQVPIDIAFWGRARLGAWFAGLNLAADLLLMADVALHFFRAYVSHNSVVVTALAQIRRHYLGARSCLACAVFSK